VKKFKFKLESVLRYKEILRDVQKGKFAIANQSYLETKDYIDSLDRKKQAVYLEMIESAEQGFSLIDQQNKESFNQKITAERTKELMRLAKRKKALDYEREKLVRFSRDQMGIEKLKDKAKQLHQKEFLDQEMKQIDDLVNSRYGIEY
jgi:flagellar protein FliJ